MSKKINNNHTPNTPTDAYAQFFIIILFIMNTSSMNINEQDGDRCC